MDKIGEKIVYLSCHKKGTHSVQTLVLELKTKEEIEKFLEILEEKSEDTQEE